MAYASSFHRLVLIGTVYNDTWNTTLSMVPVGSGLPAVSSALLNAVAVNVGTWWPKLVSASPGGGASMHAVSKLVSIKLNRIGTDGLYMDPVAMESIYGSPIAGGFSTLNPLPQVTTVATLRGTSERAHAGKGRMYLPPTRSAVEIASDGRTSTTLAGDTARGVITLIKTIVDAYNAQGVGAVAGIASRVGAGAFQNVAKVSVGRVPDTMRSRRNKQLEDPQTVIIT